MSWRAEREKTEPVASVRAGRVARVRGVVRRAQGEPLASRLGRRACVYWDVRSGLDDAPDDRDGQDFWVEDPSGKVLVRGAHVVADVRAERQRQVVRAADADQAALAARLRDLKLELRSAAGARAKALIDERKRLAKVVTVLLAVRAHGRGRVHVGGSLSAQERWIREHASSAPEGVRSLELVTEEWEVVLGEDQEVEVEGFAQVERGPAAAGGGGYRDVPTCLVLTQTPTGQPVRVRGLGEAAPTVLPPARPPERKASRPSAAESKSERARRRRFEVAVLAVVTTIAALTALTWHLSG